MSKTIALAFIGDVMLGRGVNEEIDHRSPEIFWGDTLPILQSADAVIANLECAITTHEREWQRTPKTFYFRAGPKAVDVLKVANIKCVSLANNHSLDFEEEGLLDTFKYLNSGGIYHVGAGKNLAEARMPVVMDIGGLKVGIIGMTDNEPYFAASDHPGTNYLDINTEPHTLKFLEASVSSAKRAGAQIVILTLHWGPNMVLTPSRQFREFARAAIGFGAHIIHGHSAHVFQGVQAYKGGLIMYDTGDILDDYAIDPILRNDWSFIFLVEIHEGGIKGLRMIPVRLTYAQVNLASGKEFGQIRGRMKRLCEEFGTPAIDIPEGLEVVVEKTGQARLVEYGK